MDVFTRRIIGFGIEAGFIDGISVCRMFGAAIRGQALPKRVSTDHDPLFRFHRWLATCVFWRSRRSSRFLTRPLRIRSSNA
jgi:hypothetical protein